MITQKLTLAPCPMPVAGPRLLLALALIALKQRPIEWDVRGYLELLAGGGEASNPAGPTLVSLREQLARLQRRCSELELLVDSKQIPATRTEAGAPCAAGVTNPRSDLGDNAGAATSKTRPNETVARQIAHRIVEREDVTLVKLDLIFAVEQLCTAFARALQGEDDGDAESKDGGAAELKEFFDHFMCLAERLTYQQRSLGRHDQVDLSFRCAHILGKLIDAIPAVVSRTLDNEQWPDLAAESSGMTSSNPPREELLLQCIDVTASIHPTLSALAILLLAKLVHSTLLSSGLGEPSTHTIFRVLDLGQKLLHRFSSGDDLYFMDRATIERAHEVVAASLDIVQGSDDALLTLLLLRLSHFHACFQHVLPASGQSPFQATCPSEPCKSVFA